MITRKRALEAKNNLLKVSIENISNEWAIEACDTILYLYSTIEMINSIVLGLDSILGNMRISNSQEELNNLPEEE